jgi:dTDP-4-dehydrorhamnose reductase
MRLFVTGSRGQLGRALERAAAERGDVFVGHDLPEFDITDADAVRAAVREVKPDAVINCAAFTSVDAAEAEEPKALAVNGTAVAHLAAAADEAGAVLVQISTDYVFDGTAERAYREDDPVNPRSAYGRTKLAGEVAARRARRHLVVRTAWLFGEGSNFVEAIRRQVEGGAASLRVVADQRGCPTYAGDLADALLRLLEKGATGTVHAVNGGEATWLEFAEEIVRRLGSPAKVLPITTGEAARPAPRPARAVLDTSRLRALLGGGMRPWPDALGQYLRDRRPRV